MQLSLFTGAVLQRTADPVKNKNKADIFYRSFVSSSKEPDSLLRLSLGPLKFSCKLFHSLRSFGLDPGFGEVTQIQNNPWDQRCSLCVSACTLSLQMLFISQQNASL